jgi:hypothetical protein
MFHQKKLTYVFAQATAMRVAGDKEGNGNSGKSDGDSVKGGG